MKDKLFVYTGMLQALWTYYFVMQAPPTKDQPAGEMTLAGFRLFIKDARLASDTLTPDSIERIYTSVVSGARTWVDNNKNAIRSDAYDRSGT